MKNILKDIKQNELKKVYLLYGEENYLKRTYVKKLMNAVSPDENSMNVTIIKGEDFDVPEFIGICDTMPFFADKRIVVVNRCGRFKSAKKEEEEKAVSQEDISVASKEEISVTSNEKGKKALKDTSKDASKDELAEYIKNIPDTTVVVFTEDDVDKRNKLFKAVSEYGYASEMNRLTDSDLKTWIAREFSYYNKKITEKTAVFIMTYVGTDMDVLKNEIQKVCFYVYDKESVDENDINKICTKQLSAVIFDLMDCLAVKNTAGALKIYYELMDKKESVQQVWAMLLKHFVQMYVVKEMKMLNKSNADMAAALTAHPYTITKLVREVDNFKKSEIRRKLEYGVELDEDLKNGRISDKNIVELFIAG